MGARIRLVTKQTRLAVGIGLVAAVLTLSSVAQLAARRAFAKRGPETRIEAIALKWFADMQSGRIDRAQMTPDYSAQLTDAAVQGMSHYLQQYSYGAPATGAEILNRRTMAKQTLYEVKLLFPRGDAASLLFGFNPEGKITGVSLLSIAGD
jgi:hypothetical protein